MTIVTRLQQNKMDKYGSKIKNWYMNKKNLTKNPKKKKQINRKKIINETEIIEKSDIKINNGWFEWLFGTN